MDYKRDHKNLGPTKGFLIELIEKGGGVLGIEKGIGNNKTGETWKDWGDFKETLRRL